MSKILITGVAGFIGFHLAKRLSYTKDEIIGIDNLNSYYDLELKHDRLKELDGDSSLEILSTQDRCESPINMYAASKKSNELMAHSYASLHNMKITGLRFFTVYGPWGRPDMAPMIFADAIDKDKTIRLFNHGDMYRDFTYIDDIIDGIFLVLTKESQGNYNIFNIGNSKPVCLKEFTKIMQDKFKKTATIEYLPMQKGEVYKTYADITQMREIFSFAPKVEIDAGIEKFIEWYKNYYTKELS